MIHMKYKQLLYFVFLVLMAISAAANTRNRLIIQADMGNEPDEEQQMVHLMVCSNEFDLEGLIAVIGKYLRPERKEAYHQVTHPELFHKIIDAYKKDFPNLKKHASGWHDPGYLLTINYLNKDRENDIALDIYAISFHRKIGICLEYQGLGELVKL